MQRQNRATVLVAVISLAAGAILGTGTKSLIDGKKGAESSLSA